MTQLIHEVKRVRHSGEKAAVKPSTKTKSEKDSVFPSVMIYNMNEDDPKCMEWDHLSKRTKNAIAEIISEITGETGFFVFDYSDFHTDLEIVCGALIEKMIFYYEEIPKEK